MVLRSSAIHYFDCSSVSRELWCIHASSAVTKRYQSPHYCCWTSPNNPSKWPDYRVYWLKVIAATIWQRASSLTSIRAKCWAPVRLRWPQFQLPRAEMVRASCLFSTESKSGNHLPKSFLIPKYSCKILNTRSLSYLNSLDDRRLVFHGFYNFCRGDLFWTASTYIIKNALTTVFKFSYLIFNCWYW